MGRSREGSIRNIKGVLYARLSWLDDTGRRREKNKRAKNKTHARQLIKEMIREIDDYGTRSIESEAITFEQLAVFYEQHHLRPAEYVGGRNMRERILTLEEEERLLSVCTGRRAHLRPLIIAALDTGKRRGEILKLTWEDVGFEGKLIHVKAFPSPSLVASWGIHKLTPQ